MRTAPGAAPRMPEAPTESPNSPLALGIRTADPLVRVALGYIACAKFIVTGVVVPPVKLMVVPCGPIP